ncbi:EamA family transporter [Jatrophihabitans fulvus]
MPTTADRDVTTGAGLAVVSVFSVQFGAALAAHLFDRIGALGTVGLRLVVAAVVLTALTRPWRSIRTAADLRAALVFGAVFTGMNTSLYLAIERLPLATVITLEFLGPLSVAVVTARSWTTRAWALPALAGVVLLAGRLPAGDALGIAFALGAACCWAGYIVLSGRLGREGSGLAGLAVGCLAGAVVMLPVGAATAGTALWRPEVLLIGLGVGVLSSAVPYSLDLLALRRLPTAVFGVLTSLNPGVAALAGLLLLSQVPGATQAVGIGLVMIASVGVTLTAGRKRAAPPLPVAPPVPASVPVSSS